MRLNKIEEESRSVMSVESGLESLYEEDIASADGSASFNVAQTETEAVHLVKGFLFLILAAATATASTFAFKTRRSEEVEDFYETVDRYSRQIEDSLHQSVMNKLQSARALALQFQAYANTQDKPWPFITLPYFEDHVMASEFLNDASGVSVFPIVTKDDRPEWEKYSVDARDWINASYQTQEHIFGFTGISEHLKDGASLTGAIDWFDVLWGTKFSSDEQPDFSKGISGRIFRTLSEDEKLDDKPTVDHSDGPYFPQWQAAPMGWYYQSSVNLNYGSYPDFLNQTSIVKSTGNAAFGKAWEDSRSQGYLITMLYPIFVNFYNESEVVAFVSVDTSWQTFFENILPADEDSMYVTVKNDCEQELTYELVGATARFVGNGNRKNEARADMIHSFVFGGNVMDSSSSNTTYTGRPLYGNHCPFKIFVYATLNMEERFLTNKPILFASVCCLIFVLTSFIFIGYDCLVERRQKMVLKMALRAEAVVSSLFPNDVKARLYREQQENQEKERIRDIQENDVFAALQVYVSDAPESEQQEVSPIANLYPETTILFADIVGFTAWSSSRTPTDVFLLLETLYGAFDKIAKRRNVFKVETVGDCYVAATGIPRPQERHAVIMTNFARECQATLKTELDTLAGTLGQDTLKLAMRVGIHSGPVTAGVLRGDKARFQLFGDTMNTAARLESNGRPSRIHVSQETANLLVQAGKPHWLIRRKDKINAKGKGEMQTYWIEEKAKPTRQLLPASFDDSTTCCDENLMEDTPVGPRATCEVSMLSDLSIDIFGSSGDDDPTPAVTLTTQSDKPTSLADVDPKEYLNVLSERIHKRLGKQSGPVSTDSTSTDVSVTTSALTTASTSTAPAPTEAPITGNPYDGSDTNNSMLRITQETATGNASSPGLDDSSADMNFL